MFHLPISGCVRAALAAISSYSVLYALLAWFASRLDLGTRAGIIAGVAGAVFPKQVLDEIIGSC
jgi:preprotein translocase subunit SecD